MHRRLWKWRLLRLITGLLFFLSAPWACASFFSTDAEPSFADLLHLSPAKTPIDKGWLPDLYGLPSEDQVYAAQRFVNQMKFENDPKCASVDVHLRQMIFTHFLLYQEMANAQQIYFDDQMAYRWAHLLAMISEESGGDSTNITAMSGKSISTHKASTSLEQWRKILKLTANSQIPLNPQTNFGLAQTSADRLYEAFRLAKDEKYDTAFLEGRDGANTPRKIDLNTAIAIRRVIWLYQDFAQGRISNDVGRIPEKDIDQPQYVDRYQQGLRLAILYCGTQFMFRGSSGPDKVEDFGALIKAAASIAYCNLGNSQTGYGVSEMEEVCYAQWVTLCPNLNVDISLLTPLSYFATRNATPICEDTFKQLITKQQN